MLVVTYSLCYYCVVMPPFQMPYCKHAGSAVALPLIADPETEPYKYEIQRLAIYNLIPGSTATTDDKMQGL